MNRRKHKRRMAGRGTAARSNSALKGGIGSVAAVMCIAALAGYLTAVYVIAPALDMDVAPFVFNQDAENDSPETRTPETDTEPDEVEGLAESGYVLQYGSFSTREAAEKCVSNLKLSGIEAEIMEKDGVYKVISQLFDTEEDARSTMENQKNIVDVFVTKIP